MRTKLADENQKKFFSIFSQTGELTFKSDFDFQFKDAVEFIKKELGDKSVELLKPENADDGDKQEIANIIFALIFILYKNQRAKFDYLCEKLDEKNSAEILHLVIILVF